MGKQYEDEVDDTNQDDPVDMGAQSWADLYSRRPDLLDHPADWEE